MFKRLLVAAAIGAMTAGCSGYTQPPAAFHEVLTQPYHLDSNDRVRVIVFGQQDLSNTYIVDQAGYISVPLVGNIPARGKTPQQLSAAIAAALRKGYLRDPDVSVEISQYRPIFVMGEVQASGQYPYVSGMTVQNAIATAGGFSSRADQKDADVTRQINGKVLTGRVPITDPIRPGDTIYVRERVF